MYVKAKHCLALSINFWKQKVCWHHPAMFCFITSIELSRQLFEFSLNVKVMGSSPSYLLESFYFIYQILRNNVQMVILCLSYFITAVVCVSTIVSRWNSKSLHMPGLSYAKDFWRNGRNTQNWPKHK